MEKKLEAFVIQKTNDLIKAPSACQEAVAEAKAFLKALRSASEKAEAKRYIKELEEDITPIDGLVAFAKSDFAIKEFGVEGQKQFLAHALKLKADGALYCDCPACTAAKAILDRKNEILK